MSILSEYAKHESIIGKERYQALDEYLNEYPELDYPTVVYHQSEWAKFEEWFEREKGGTAKESVK